MTKEQTPEADAFLARVVALSAGADADALDGVLAPAIADETALRRLWASDRSHVRLANPHVGLVDVFAAPAAVRTTYARRGEEDLDAQHVMPVRSDQRRSSGEPCMSVDMAEFMSNFKIFTEGSLGQLDWSNVVCAGGSVLACLQPVPEAAKASKRALRKHFHTRTFPTSDVDLFLWGLSPEQAEVKLQAIYEAVRDAVPWDVTCVRTKHAISIYSQYPYRAVQIVLRLYSSPAEILAGFDVDAPCVAFDGTKVWASPRSLVAQMRQANTIDVSRRSPSYEVRLAKYAARGFEIRVPGLRRAEVDPTIFERAITRIGGLARLLVLEKLAAPDTRVAYLDHRRELRGRPAVERPWTRRTRVYKGDLKAAAAAALAQNDYDGGGLHIPYGPGWDARRIDKLVYQSDLGMNSPFNPKNKKRKLHRHPAFFGTMLECIEDCCEHCPEPENDEERKLQADEDASDKYIRGRIVFIQENPGRQTISGSFNPIDDSEWAEQAYLGPTERFFAAIAARDRVAVAALLNDGTDPNRRDHAGRAPLHVAILAGATDVAGDLVDAGARMTARLVDGRSALHLAAQAGLPALLRKMFARSAQNAARVEAAAAKGAGSDDGMDVDDGAPPPASDSETERASSEDDWSSDSGDEVTGAAGKNKPAEGDAEPAVDAADASGEVPEDAEDEPDVLDPDAPDWDLAFTPVDHAVAAGSVDALGVLLAHGASPSKVTKAHGRDAEPVSALTLAGVRHDDVLGLRLLMAGASASTAHEETSLSALHRLVRMGGNASLIAALLRNDEKARAISDRPAFSSNVATYPLVSAIDAQDWATAAVLLAYGARWLYTAEDESKDTHAHNERRRGKDSGTYYRNNTAYPQSVYMPLDVALGLQDPIAFLLLALGAEVNLQPHSLARYSYNATNNVTILDYARRAVKHIQEAIKALDKPQDAKDADSEPPLLASLDMHVWAEYYAALNADIKQATTFRAPPDPEKEATKHVELQAQLLYWSDVLAALEARNAKSWNELNPQNPAPTSTVENATSEDKVTKHGYTLQSSGYPSEKAVPLHLLPLYDELYQACWAGDETKIKELCTPDETKTDKTVLEVAVQVVEDSSRPYRSGPTPLHVAILRRHWNAAKLLLALCIAQYKPEEKKLERFGNAFNDDDDEDEDMEDDDDDEGSQGTAVPLEDQFTDLTNAPMTVQSVVSPIAFLTMVSFSWVAHDGSYRAGDSLAKAISDVDVEAFTQIASLHASISKIAPPLSIAVHRQVQYILEADSPDFLDEVIRRCGVGAPYAVEEKEEEDKSQTQADSQAEEKPKPKPGKRVYWGLNVHGVKRKDLASRNDPDAKPKSHGQRVHEMPLLWQAVRVNAVRIVEYLNSKRPLEAYAHYAAHEKDARAMKLRTQGDLAVTYPDWIGWKPDALGQSVLLAAVSPYAPYKDFKKVSMLDTLKKLFEIQPTLLQDQLNLPIKSLNGETPLLVAVARNLDAPTVEFLVKKGASYEVSSDDGSNILHLAVKGNNVEAVEWILKNMPRETVANLLIQATFDSRETAMHRAVDAGKASVVKALAAGDIQPRALVARNLQGAVPLHLAIHKSSAEIAHTLLDAALRTGTDVDIENGMGDTPLEVARQKLWLQKTRDTRSMGGIQEPCLLTPGYSINMPNPQKVDVPALEEQLAEFKTTLADLSSHNELVRTGPTQAMDDFIGRVTKHIASLRSLTPDVAMNEDAPTGNKHARTHETTEEEATFLFVQAAYAGQAFKRRLVRLDEVQEAVQSELDDRQQAAERAEAEEAKKKDHEGGLLEGAKEVDDDDQDSFTFNGFSEFRLNEVADMEYGNRYHQRGVYAPRKRLFRRH